MGRISGKWVIIALSCALAYWTASAQTTGRIQGRTVGENGAPLGGVNVAASGPHLQGARVDVTGKDGKFRLLALPPGPYVVSAGLQGFNLIEMPDVRVTLDGTVTLELTLSSTLVEQVTVTARAPMIDIATTTTGAKFSPDVFNNIPTGRTFTGLAMLAPGVTDGGLGENPSIRGASAAENRYLVDGLDITDPGFGIVGSQLPFEFVEELEVKTGGYQAEYGGALGGVINVVTPSGSNEFHGEVFGYFIDDGLQASSKSTAEFGQRLGFSRYDYGFDVGGKLVEDKLWYFIAVNQSVDEEDWVNRQEIPFTTKTERLYYAGKLTWQINPDHRLTASVFGDPTDVSNVGPYYRFGWNTLNSAGQVLHDADEGANNFSLKYEGQPAQRLFVEVVGGRYKRTSEFMPIDGSSPIYSDNTGTGFWAEQQDCGDPSLLNGSEILFAVGCRGGYFSQEHGDRSRNQLRAVTTWFHGRHEVKAGAEYRDVKFHDVFHHPGPFDGPLVDDDNTVIDPDGVAGGKFNLSASELNLWIWDNDSRGETEELAIFVQDRWHVSPAFTLDVGVRLSSSESKGERHSLEFEFGDMIAPRLGFTWDLAGRGRSKLFGNFARYYESVPLNINVRDLGSETLAIYGFSYPADGSLPTYTNLGTVAWSYSWEASKVEVEQGIDPQYTDEYALGFQYAVRSDMSVGATAVYRELGDVIEDFAVDGIGDSFFVGNPGGFYTELPVTGEPLPEPVFVPEPVREYRALELALTRPLKNNWQLFANYVYSKNEGNYEGLFASTFNNLAPHTGTFYFFPSLMTNAYGLLPNDRKHYLKVYGSYQWPFDLVTGFSGRYLGGTPTSKFGSHTLFESGRYVTPRGSAGRTPDLWSLDVHLEYPIRIRRDVHLRVFTDVFNVTNEQEAILVNQQWTFAVLEESVDPNECGGPGTGPGTDCPEGNPSWGTPIAYQLPRSVRFGAKLTW